ncbi:MAG: phosphatase PAP2 family protein [Bowdeniella nasicola]|nr:phosphatase PAP2 family protein [Bowdeniella nasicola]
MTTRSPYRWALAAGALSVVVAIVIGSLVHTHPAVWDRLILAQLLAARTDDTTSTLVSITTLFNPLGSVLLALALALAVTVAVSRLYLGVHWFTDTLAGGLIGCGGTLLMSFLLVGAQQRREARQRMNARAGSSNSAATSARKREPSSPSTSR